MCATKEEHALRLYQVARLRVLVRTCLRVFGILFICVGLDAILLNERIPSAPSYRFIFGWDTFPWWRDLAVGWGVLFVTVGGLLFAASTLYPRLLRTALGLSIIITCWWAAALVVECIWAEVVHRNPQPTLYPMFAWTAWCVTLISINLIPRVAPNVSRLDDRGPTKQDVERARKGLTDVQRERLAGKVAAATMARSKTGPPNPTG